MKKWKKILFTIAVAIVILRIIYIGGRGELEKVYVVSTNYDLTNVTEMPCQNVAQSFVSNGKRLNSIELLLDNVADSENGTLTMCIYKEEQLIYQTNVSLGDISNVEWKRVYVNAEMEEGQVYLLTLNTNDNCVQIPNVIISENGVAQEIVASSVGEQVLNGNILIAYGYLQTPGIVDRGIMISIWILLLVIFALFLYYFETIQNQCFKICKMLEKRIRSEHFLIAIQLLSCMVIMYCSGIEFQPATRILLYGISLISVVQYKAKSEWIQDLTNRPYNKVLMYLLYAYAAFAMVGQRIFIYPLTMRVTITGIFVYLITLFWMIPVLKSVIYYMEMLCQKGFSQGTQKKTVVFVVLCMVFLLLPAAYNLFANNPGIASGDTYDCMVVNAKNLKGMYDWHPAFYCMVLRAIQLVWDSTYAVILVQYFFWGYVVMELLLYLRKKGMKDAVLFAVAALFGFNAANFLHINTIWKDIPYTLSLLWAFIIVAKLVIDYEEYRDRWYIYLELIIAMTGIYLYRKNGIVAFAFIAIALLTVLRKNIKIWCSLAIAVLLIGLVKGPVYDYFEVQDPGKRGMYIGLSQDILGAYYGGGEVSEGTLQMINVMTKYNDAEYQYLPTWAYQSYDLEVETGVFIRNYLDTFVKNPILMLRAVIAREDAAWNIYSGKDAVLGCVNYTWTEDGGTREPNWNEFYPERYYGGLYSRMLAATSYTANTQWIGAIEWRGGLLTLLGLISLVYMLCRKGAGKTLILIIPSVGHFMSLLLSTGWSDFRYYWPLNLMNFAMIFLVLVVVRQKGKGI